MKKIENRFESVVELRNCGASVLSAKVTTSLNLTPQDSVSLGSTILGTVMPAWASLFPLYSGEFLLVREDCKPVGVDCLLGDSRPYPDIKIDLELNDGIVHTVFISLFYSDDCRHDYSVNGVRVVRLVGRIAIEVEDHEMQEA